MNRLLPGSPALEAPAPRSSILSSTAAGNGPEAAGLDPAYAKDGLDVAGADPCS